MSYDWPHWHHYEDDEQLKGATRGPLLAALLDSRIGHTGLQLVGNVGLDDDGQWRCLVCLRPVEESRVKAQIYSTRQYRARIMPGRMITGYELVCCGATP